MSTPHFVATHVRYTTLALCVAAAVASLPWMALRPGAWPAVIFLLACALILVGLYVLWVIALALLGMYLWKSNLKRIVVQGG